MYTERKYQTLTFSEFVPSKFFYVEYKLIFIDKMTNSTGEHLAMPLKRLTLPSIFAVCINRMNCNDSVTNNLLRYIKSLFCFSFF